MVDRSPLGKNSGFCDKHSTFQIYNNFSYRVGNKDSIGFSLIGLDSPQSILPSINMPTLQFMNVPTPFNLVKVGVFLSTLAIQKIIRIVDINYGFKAITSKSILNFSKALTNYIHNNSNSNSMSNSSSNAIANFEDEQQKKALTTLVPVPHRQQQPSSSSKMRQAAAAAASSSRQQQKNSIVKRKYSASNVGATMNDNYYDDTSDEEEFFDDSEFDGSNTITEYVNDINYGDRESRTIFKNCDETYTEMVPMTYVRPMVCASEVIVQKEKFPVDKSINSPIVKKHKEQINDNIKSSPHNNSNNLMSKYAYDSAKRPSTGVPSSKYIGRVKRPF